MAIINANWFIFAVAIFVSLPILNSWSYLFLEIYLFFEDRIVVQNHKGELIKELFFVDVYAWNEHKKQIKEQTIRTLLIKASTGGLAIHEADYSNYKKMVQFVKSKSFSQDEVISEKDLDNVILNPIYKDFFTVRFLFTLLLILCFTIIMSQKERVHKKLIFKDKIDNVNLIHLRNYHYAEIRLKNQRHIIFKTTNDEDVDTFRNYDQRNISVVPLKLRDSITLTVDKSEYNWKANHEMIKKIRLGWDAEVKIIKYTLH